MRHIAFDGFRPSLSSYKLHMDLQCSSRRPQYSIEWRGVVATIVRRSNTKQLFVTLNFLPYKYSTPVLTTQALNLQLLAYSYHKNYNYLNIQFYKQPVELLFLTVCYH